jgi:hypothetical protein
MKNRGPSNIRLEEKIGLMENVDGSQESGFSLFFSACQLCKDGGVFGVKVMRACGKSYVYILQIIQPWLSLLQALAYKFPVS